MNEEDPGAIAEMAASYCCNGYIMKNISMRTSKMYVLSRIFAEVHFK
jgi:hypothetical protein